ncbi:pseudouridine synthase [Diplocloster modestus]|uniref:Pseudouridine synthase n=1 Tax=Diplocloster modestus TaxID=2850322 RepID=A0ABS6K6G2_9FIRM|nr:pseudouridine synthase [Diplocloster modestus]MBU9726088.1 pseudouridine synthase [Diplocloster modestus]
MEEVRLNKYLSEAGVCSRREADRLIEAGKVTVDGVPAVTGMKVREDQRILVNGRPACKEEEMILLVVNKPRGIVCTAEKREKNNIIEFLHYPKRIYPVGRLDKDSEGLLLMTNNGEIVNKIMRSGNRHEKEYVVTVNREVTEEFVRAMAGGIPILDTVTRKCEVQKLDKYRFRIVLTQGLNRQIRRMCEYLGYRVAALTRVRIMNIRLGNLKPGAYRKVTPQEWRTLQELIRDSSNTTVIEERTNG